MSGTAWLWVMAHSNSELHRYLYCFCGCVIVLLPWAELAAVHNGCVHALLRPSCGALTASCVSLWMACCVQAAVSHTSVAGNAGSGASSAGVVVGLWNEAAVAVLVGLVGLGGWQVVLGAVPLGLHGCGCVSRQDVQQRAACVLLVYQCSPSCVHLLFSPMAYI